MPQAKGPGSVKRLAAIVHTSSRIPAADHATTSAGCAVYFFDQYVITNTSSVSKDENPNAASTPSQKNVMPSRSPDQQRRSLKSGIVPQLGGKRRGGERIDRRNESTVLLRRVPAPVTIFSLRRTHRLARSKLTRQTPWHARISAPPRSLGPLKSPNQTLRRLPLATPKETHLWQAAPVAGIARIRTAALRGCLAQLPSTSLRDTQEAVDGP